MDFRVKALVGGVLLAITGHASATVQFDSAGGELFLTVSFLDQSSGVSQSYIQDLGVTVANFSTASRPVAGNNTFSGSGANNAGTVAASAIQAGSVNTPGYSVSWTNAAVPGLFGGNFGNASYQIYAGVPKNNLNSSLLFLSTTNQSADVVNMSNGEALALKGITTFLSNANAGGTMPSTTAVNGSFFTSDPNNSGNVNKTLGNNWSGNFVAGGSPLDATAQVGTSLAFYQIANSSRTAVDLANVTPFAGAWLLNADGKLTYSVTAVPEPGSLALLLAGLGVIGIVARRRLA